MRGWLAWFRTCCRGWHQQQLLEQAAALRRQARDYEAEARARYEQATQCRQEALRLELAARAIVQNPQ